MVSPFFDTPRGLNKDEARGAFYPRCGGIINDGIRETWKPSDNWLKSGQKLSQNNSQKLLVIILL